MDNLNAATNGTTISTPEYPFYTAAVFGTIACIGILGNFLVATAVANGRNKALDDYLIITLSISDIVSASCVLYIVANQFVRIDPASILTQCRLYMSFVYASTGICICSLLVITINRYLHVLHRHFQARVMEARKGHIAVVAFLIFVGLFNFCVIGMNPLNPVVYGPKRGWCYLDGLLVRGGEFFFFFFPLIAMIVLYTRIFIHFKIQRNKVAQMAAKNLDQQGSKTSDDSIKLIKTMVTLIFAYCMCFLPYLITQYVKPIEPHVQILGVAMVNVTSLVDPVLYTIMNSRIRKRIVRIFIRCQCCRTLLGGVSGPNRNGDESTIGN